MSGRIVKNLFHPSDSKPQIKGLIKFLGLTDWWLGLSLQEQKQIRAYWPETFGVGICAGGRNPSPKDELTEGDIISASMTPKQFFQILASSAFDAFQWGPQDQKESHRRNVLCFAELGLKSPFKETIAPKTGNAVFQHFLYCIIMEVFLQSDQYNLAAAYAQAEKKGWSQILREYKKEFGPHWYQTDSRHYLPLQEHFEEVLRWHARRCKGLRPVCWR